MVGVATLNHELSAAMNHPAAPNLTQRPPRSPRVRLGGYVLLARLLDKGRAELAGTAGEYKFKSMEESKQELVELEAMYKQEDFAELTKELVISRGRKRLEFSQRGFELAQKAQQELVGHDLPKKEMEANQAVEKAEKALREVQAKKDRGAIEIKLKLMRAEHKIDDLEREIEKMKKKSEKKEPAA
jgi:hypothetical protein